MDQACLVTFASCLLKNPKLPVIRRVSPNLFTPLPKWPHRLILPFPLRTITCLCNWLFKREWLSLSRLVRTQALVLTAPAAIILSSHIQKKTKKHFEGVAPHDTLTLDGKQRLNGLTEVLRSLHSMDILFFPFSWHRYLYTSIGKAKKWVSRPRPLSRRSDPWCWFLHYWFNRVLPSF